MEWTTNDERNDRATIRRKQATNNDSAKHSLRAQLETQPNSKCVSKFQRGLSCTTSLIVIIIIIIQSLNTKQHSARVFENTRRVADVVVVAVGGSLVLQLCT